MKTTIMQKIALVVVIFSLAISSCKKDKNEVPTPPQEVLTANAGTDQTTEVAQTVTLDGSASVSSLNKPFQYKWTISNKPAGSTVTLSHDTEAKPVFVPDMVGTYELTLTISNESGQNSDKVLVTAGAAQPLAISDDINVETVLVDRVPDPTLPDYIVTKDIAVNAQLTLKPGVVIQVKRDKKLEINESGIIIARGTADKMITFTGEEATAGFWKGITIYSNTTGNIFEYVQILNAGSIPGLNATKASLTLFGISHAYISLKHCLISGSGGYGLFAASGSVLGDFVNNVFTTNALAGALMDGLNVPKLDKESVFTGGNGRDVVEVLPTIINNATHSEEEWKGFNDHTPFRLIGDLSAATGWKIDPGVIIECANQVTIEIQSAAYVSAVGTSESPVVFTGATKVKGFWKGIRSNSTSVLNRIEYAEISYAGSSTITSNKKASIAVIGSLSTMSVKNTKITNCDGYGIYVGYTSSINDDAATVNTFEGNTQDNILKD